MDSDKFYQSAFAITTLPRLVLTITIANLRSAGNKTISFNLLFNSYHIIVFGREKNVNPKYYFHKFEAKNISKIKLF